MAIAASTHAHKFSKTNAEISRLSLNYSNIALTLSNEQKNENSHTNSVTIISDSSKINENDSMVFIINIPLDNFY